MEMFCRQCEQTYNAVACNKMGVCGKKPEVSNLQDLLIHALKALAVYGKMARELGQKDTSTDFFVMEGVFMTLTNVNFDPETIIQEIHKAYKIKETLRKSVTKLAQEKDHSLPAKLPAVAHWVPSESREGLLKQASGVGLLSNPSLAPDLRSLREILLLGLKGLAAYAAHAYRLGKTDEVVTDFLYKALAALADEGLSAETLLSLILGCGEANLKCLEILDKAHTDHFGHPVPTTVKIGFQKGPAIIVSGHDLADLEQLLIQTEGKGVNIYTHGEMLPAHGYPGLKKYRHLVGHFGTAWQNQQKEFANIPAAILMTTNCIQEPHITYADRIYTTGAVGWPGINHIPEGFKKDFSAVIKRAESLGGFKNELFERDILVGFAHHAVLGVADKIIEAVKAGKIRHFFLIGGCDGARPGRNYFSKFAEQVPHDCLILTLACGKHRINRHEYGVTAGFPRLLDCGQCNDAYSAIVIAQALAKAFNCGVNDLPLSMIVSWYEQKAVVILLTLLFLGIKNIRLGPTLPAFITPNVLKILVDKFQIKPTGVVEEDLALALQNK